jgi:nitrate reductase NapE component
MPARYRERHYQDHYQGIHFALIDIMKDDSAAELLLYFHDHVGNIIMEKTVRLRSKAERREFADYLLGTQHHSIEDAVDSFHCGPYWGNVGIARDYVTRSVIAFYLLAFVVLPFLSVVWFVGASIYYVVMGAEHERRRIILERNRATK